MTVMIEAIGVRQQFGSHTVLDRVDMELHRGEVLGLLGANGAGKSTLLRVVAGIDVPNGGVVNLGNTTRGGEPRVGALLDPGWLDDRLTCKQHLTIACLNARGRVSREEIGSRISAVGLDGAEKRRVRHLSLGMRQRLALAIALVDSPDVLVLDEPLNGLDPDGVLWMRGLIVEFAEGGGAVLLSSHLMAEMERIATRVLLLSNGSVQELDREQSSSTSEVIVRAEAALEALQRRLEARGRRTNRQTDGSLIISGTDTADVFREAAALNVVLTHLADHVQSLEEQYREAVSHRR